MGKMQKIRTDLKTLFKLLFPDYLTSKIRLIVSEKPQKEEDKYLRAETYYRRMKIIIYPRLMQNGTAIYRSSEQLVNDLIHETRHIIQYLYIYTFESRGEEELEIDARIFSIVYMIKNLKTIKKVYPEFDVSSIYSEIFYILNYLDGERVDFIKNCDDKIGLYKTIDKWIESTLKSFANEMKKNEYYFTKIWK